MVIRYLDFTHKCVNVLSINPCLILVQQEVIFKVDYKVPSINREFGSVFMGEKNVACLVVAAGWAKVSLFPFLGSHC